MPDAVSFRVTTYRKLAKGETGLTQMASARLAASEGIDWGLSELPDDAVTVSHDETGETVTPAIDWSEGPDFARRPRIRGRFVHQPGPPRTGRRCSTPWPTRPSSAATPPAD